MSAKHKLIVVGIAVTVVHFLATWGLLLQSWSQAWALTLLDVFFFPAQVALHYFFPRRYGPVTLMVCMFANSVLWSLCISALVLLGRWLFQRRRSK